MPHRSRVDDHLLSFVPTIPDFPRPGILFYDITGLVRDGVAYQTVLAAMTESLRGLDVDMVAGVESQGYLFAAPLADRLHVGFVPLRKPGKLPRARISADYDLEYASGRLEMHVDAISRDQRVALVDDVVATGGTMEAGLTLIKEVGGIPVAGVCFLDLAELRGRARIESCGVDLFSVVSV